MRFIFTLLLALFAWASVAQQGLQFMLPDEDSLPATTSPALAAPLLPPAIGNTELPVSGLQTMQFNDQLGNENRFTLNSSVLEMPQLLSIPQLSLSGFSPFYSNIEIFDGSATKLNDKLTVGGFHYGANSMFSAPLPKANSSYFDTYGSTMFMEYKVSKNIKIETRVSVGHSNTGPPLSGY